MAHDIFLTSCSLPIDRKLVYFWDWVGDKHTGRFISKINKFVEMTTGLGFTPIDDIIYWDYVR